MMDYSRTKYVLGTTLLVETIATFIVAMVMILAGDVVIKNEATHLIALMFLLFVMIETITVTTLRFEITNGPTYKENLKRFNSGKKVMVEPNVLFLKNSKSDIMKFLCRNASFYAYKKEHGYVGVQIVYYPKNKEAIYRNIKMKKRYFYKYFLFSKEEAIRRVV